MSLKSDLSPSLALLQRLISFDTTSYRSNLELIDFVEAYLQRFGIHCQRSWNPEHTKANLHAVIGATQDSDTPGIMLSGHTDVVPVDGQDWQSAPFELRLTGQNCYGRGTADMKGFIACVLAAVPMFCEQPLKTPIQIALSFDEEVGCLGVRHLLDMLVAEQTPPAVVIVGEPTRMEPVTGHKGKQAFDVLVTGKAGHSAYTRDGVNAIDYAARMIGFINELHRQRSTLGPFDEGYRVAHTTLHIGTIKGGEALNIIPAQCSFRFEIRNIPTDDPAVLIDDVHRHARMLSSEMAQTDPSCGVALQPVSDYPGLHTDPGSPAVDWIRQLLDSNQPLQKVSFGTEGGLFSQRLSVPVVVCGPGDIAQAHKPDEYVSREQLASCDAFLQRLARFCRDHAIVEVLQA